MILLALRTLMRQVRPFGMMLALPVLLSLLAGGAAGIYSGHQQQIQVPVPRLESTVVVDGTLDEPVWQQAALLTDFSQYAPADGRPADDRTDVLVSYSPTAIFFGIRAHAAPGSVRATLADRDKIDSDDYVQIFLSTFHYGRQAMMFGVNPIGVQINTETGVLMGGVSPKDDAYVMGW